MNKKIKKNLPLIAIIAAIVIIGVFSSGVLPFSFNQIINPPQNITVEFEGHQYSGTFQTSSGEGSRSGVGTSSATADGNLVLRSTASSSKNANSQTNLNLIGEVDLREVTKVNLNLDGSMRMTRGHNQGRPSGSMEIFIVVDGKQQTLVSFSQEIPNDDTVKEWQGTFEAGNIVVNDGILEIQNVDTSGQVRSSKSEVNISGAQEPVYIGFKTSAATERTRANTIDIEARFSVLNYVQVAQPVVQEASDDELAPLVEQAKVAAPTPKTSFESAVQSIDITEKVKEDPISLVLVGFFVIIVGLLIYKRFK